MFYSLRTCCVYRFSSLDRVILCRFFFFYHSFIRRFAKFKAQHSQTYTIGNTTFREPKTWSNKTIFDFSLKWNVSRKSLQPRPAVPPPQPTTILGSAGSMTHFFCKRPTFIFRWTFRISLTGRVWKRYRNVSLRTKVPWFIVFPRPCARRLYTRTPFFFFFWHKTVVRKNTH